MTDEPLRLGILSTAGINGKVIPAAQASPAVEVLAVASREQARAEAYAREWAIPVAHGSYEELLADPAIEAVYVPLPNSQHCDWSIRALEAGKHVLCEKPMSRHPAAVEEAFAVAARAGLVLTEAFMYRHNPQTLKLQALVAEGAIGELQLVRSAFSFPLTDPDNVRLRADLDGGALMDVGCYTVSGSRLLAGEPERVFGEQLGEPGGVDVRFHGTMRHAGGVVSQFDCGFVLPGRDELEAIGTEGSLFVDDPWHCRTPVLELRRHGEQVERIAVEPADSYRLELENLAAAVRGRAEPLLGRADAVGNARAIEALYRSAESGHAVALS